jgi:hypothetical protein
MRTGIKNVISAWYNRKRITCGNKYTDGSTIFYYGNAIARWCRDENEKLVFEINTCYHSWSKSTREYINNVIRFVYGENAPYLVQENDIIYMVHPESGEKNEWADSGNRSTRGWFRFTDSENFKFTF